jgi:hypothetical protein
MQRNKIFLIVVKDVHLSGVLGSSCLSVGSRGTTLVPLEGFSLNLIFEYFSKICRKKLKFHQNLTRITGVLREDLCLLMTSRIILLRMKNGSEKATEKIGTHILCSRTFFSSKIVLFMR